MKKFVTICIVCTFMLSMSPPALGMTRVAFSSTRSWWTYRADTATTTTAGPFYLFTSAQARETVTPGPWVTDADRAPTTGFWQKTALGTTEPVDPEHSGIGTNANATCYSKAVSTPLPLSTGWGLAKAWQSTGFWGNAQYHFYTDAGRSASPSSVADGDSSAFDPVEFTWEAGTHTLELEYGLSTGTVLSADPDTHYGQTFDVNGEDYTRRIFMTQNGQIDFLGDLLGDQGLFSLTIAYDGTGPVNDLVLGANVTITESSLGNTESIIEDALAGMWSENGYDFSLESDFYMRLAYTFTLSEAETISVSYGCESAAGVEAVPEPMTICLLSLGSLILLKKRRA